MTKEERQLLINDLCARLPYRVICQLSNKDADVSIIEKLGLGGLEHFIAGSMCVKPYLRPMSSMTEEEKRELKATTCPNGTGYFDEKYLLCPMNHYGEQISYEFMQSIIDWLNEHHFDYRGLIEKGLAIDCTNLNIY